MRVKRQEKRRGRRVQATFWKEGDEPRGGFTIDISSGGLFIGTNRPYSRGTVVTAKLTLDDEEIEVKGKVAHARKVPPGLHAVQQPGMGISYLEFQPALAALIGESVLAGETAASEPEPPAAEPSPAPGGAKAASPVQGVAAGVDGTDAGKLQRQLEHFKATIVESELLRRRMEDESEADEREKTMLRSIIENLERTNETLAVELMEEKEKQNGGEALADERLAELDDRLARAGEAELGLHQRITELESTLAAMEGERERADAELSERLEHSETREKELRERIAELEETLEAVAGARADLETELARRQEGDVAARELRAQVVDLEEAVSSLEAERAELAAELGPVRAELERYRGSVVTEGPLGASAASVPRRRLLPAAALFVAGGLFGALVLGVWGPRAPSPGEAVIAARPARDDAAFQGTLPSVPASVPVVESELEAGEAAVGAVVADIADAAADEAGAGDAPPAAGEPVGASGSQDLARIPEAVNSWAAAWSSQRVGDYLSHYSANFTPDGGLSRDAWEAQRRVRISGPPSIEVSLGEIETTVLGSEEVEASFRQSYQTPTYSDEVTKVLTLRWEGNEWKIVRERSNP